MRNSTRSPASLAGFALLALLTACGGQEQPAGNAAANGLNAAMADPDDPFGQSEAAMDQAILAAVGVNPADSWVRKMIAHHQGAIAMSRIVLQQDPSSDVATMARTVIDKQSREIAELEKLVAGGNPDQASGELYRPATVRMRAAMMAATGADVSELFLRKMLAHHEGAVAMSDIALANGASGAVRAQISKTRSDQQKDAAMVEAMLRGEPMQAADTSDGQPPVRGAVPTAARPAPKPATPPKAAPKPKPAQPAPDPHAGHDMNNM